jgi:glycosyltransferase involved in cell wall biosynthesis
VTVTVSAIIPTYNRADFVCHAIESALAQHVPNREAEVIIVDDGSTDGTAALVTNRYGDRVQYLAQENHREGAARNAGVQRAAGAYLAFLDSDDYWLPGKLARDVARLESTDQPALVYSRALNVDPEDRPMGARRLPAPEGDVFWQLARDSFIAVSTVTVRADAFREVRGFVEDRALSGTADWELWMRLAARWPIGFVDQTATCVRVHPRRAHAPSNMLADPAWMESGMLAGVRYSLADPYVAQRAGRQARAIRSHMYVTIALNAYANGLRRRSWSWLARSVRAWPPQLLDARFWGAASRAALGRDTVRRLVPSPSGRGLG